MTFHVTANSNTSSPQLGLQNEHEKEWGVPREEGLEIYMILKPCFEFKVNSIVRA
jgi:hypothetical protein